MKVSDARQHNRSRVLGAIISSGRASRTDLATRTGLSKPTVSRMVDELLRDGLVAEASPQPQNRRGRSAVPLELARDRGAVCGIDLGATTTRFILSDLACHPLAVERRATPARRTGKALARWVLDTVEALRERSSEPELWGLAVGVPGVVHPDTGEIRCAPNLPGIEGHGFAAHIHSRLGDVSIENDANLALLGELYFGSARGRRSAVIFTLGTGVGAGVVIDGHLYRGKRGFVGEFGSLLTGSDSRTLEDALSAAGMLKTANSRGLSLSSAEELFAPDATPRVKAIRREAETSLLVALTAATAAYEPEIIVLGGGVSASLGPWLPGVRSRLHAAMPAAPSVVLSELSDLAGALGGLAQALSMAYARLDVSLADLDGMPAAGQRQVVLSWLGGLTDVH